MIVYKDVVDIDSHHTNSRRKRKRSVEQVCNANPSSLATLLNPSSASSTLQERQSALSYTIGDTSGCPTSRKVALIGIATDCSYTASFDSTESVRQNILNVVNTASGVFESTFNISLGLRNLTISDAGCPSAAATDSAPWNVPCSSGNITWRLQSFSQWRSEIVDDDNAYWTLMTDCPTGGEVGISWIGALCNSGNGSSYASSTGVSANVVARTSSEWQVFA